MAGAMEGHELLLPGCRAAHNVEEDSARVRRQVRTLTEAAKDRPGYICADVSEGVEAVSPTSPMFLRMRQLFSSVPTDWGQQHTALQKRQMCSWHA